MAKVQINFYKGIKTMQSINQVKQALANGLAVHWSNSAYKILDDSTGLLVSYRNGLDYASLHNIKQDVLRCYVSKADCLKLAKRHGVQFVCYEPIEDAYYFQSGDYQSGFYEYRILANNLICEKSFEIMIANGLSDTNKATFEK